MPRRNPVPVLVTVAFIIALVGAYGIFQLTTAHRLEETHQILEERSILHLSMNVRHDTGPLAEEQYVMSDDDGISKSSYRGIARSGMTITVAERPRRTTEEGPNVAFLFEQAVQDGIWELASKPPRGNTSTSYTIDVSQVVGRDHGARSFTFTDPHYWATTIGHEFHIQLAKNKPLPDLLSLKGTKLVEPRYQLLVDDFTTFGPPSFRNDVGNAQKRLEAHG